MNSELSKIRFYFEEGARLWNTMPEEVVGRNFFVLWEKVQHPMPFRVEGDELELFGQRYALMGKDEEKTAFFRWDETEMCASVVVESVGWEQKLLLTFDNGMPRIYETTAEMLEPAGLEHGEKLEIIYDVIVEGGKRNPGRNILELSKKEYLELLDLLEPRHERASIRAMRSLPAFSMKKLLKTAAEDMAIDETGPQLSLPLGGSYAGGFEPGEEAPSREIRSAVPGQTGWEIWQLLEFLRLSCRNIREMEEHFVLEFRNAEIIGGEGGNEAALKFPFTASAVLEEGAILPVYYSDTREDFGTFRVDMCDGNELYGRLRWHDPCLLAETLPRLFARPRKSPFEFLHLGMEALANLFKLEKGDTLSGAAIRAALGQDTSSHVIGVNPAAPEHLDHSQRNAWTCAVDPRNVITLVQGPPGTGKTSVLEAVLRQLCSQRKRVLVTAPSNTAVDNICRRVADLPVLRFGNNPASIAPDVLKQCWVGDDANVRKFKQRREDSRCGGIYAGTHVGVLRDGIVVGDMERNGLYDVLVYDEAGMTPVHEFLLSCRMAERVVLFGDHQQLPPFPMPEEVKKKTLDEFGPAPKRLRNVIERSALEWLSGERGFPTVMLKSSYRCQNPRLLRFASILFYDAGVRPSRQAEYFRLPFHERQSKYPQSSLRLIKTSSLPPELRCETMTLEGRKPGLENRLEAMLCRDEVYAAMAKYPLNEITVISPYRRQVKLIRNLLDRGRAATITGNPLGDSDWENFLATRIATVDSFQGGESDIVIISYVRSSVRNGGVGFVDDPNRINVAHTRCRREMVVIGDIDHLKAKSANNIFSRMERAFARDGEIIQPDPNSFKDLKRSSM